MTGERLQCDREAHRFGAPDDLFAGQMLVASCTCGKIDALVYQSSDRLSGTIQFNPVSSADIPAFNAIPRLVKGQWRDA